MPIYQYRCNDCDNVTDVLRSINSNDVVRCDVCNGSTSKIMSAATIVYKGDGFCLTSEQIRARSGE